MKTDRLDGYDIARALAVVGMVLVDFKIVMDAGQAGPDWLIWFAGLFDGRASATFVILAGAGMSLMTNRAREAEDTERLGVIRITLLKRALFLFIFGLLYTPLWPADILHFYGLYLTFGVLILTVSGRTLWGLALGIVAAFVTLMAFVDYEAGWNFITLEYLDFWTVNGFVRHLFFNGFHPVLPWIAFLCAGIWLGRQDLSDDKRRFRIMGFALGILVVTEAVSSGLVQYILTFYPHGLDTETTVALFGTTPMPPLPLYMLAGTATAFVVICLCITAARAIPASWKEPFVATGQLALSLYVAHVVVGMVTLDLLGRLEDQSLAFAVFSTIVFYGIAVLFAWRWRRRFDRGPLEMLMRRITA